uniref:DRBM domain-containing protein n=1 Tax=Megavirus baoshan TaxID=2496520 RepID=A0A3S8UXH9_9VIRU
MNSPKNKLQEYFQKNKLPMPIYNSISSGPDHNKIWTSSIVATINGQEFTLVGSKNSNSKTVSQQMVATEMIEYLSKINNDSDNNDSDNNDSDNNDSDNNDSDNNDSDNNDSDNNDSDNNNIILSEQNNNLKNIAQTIYLLDLENKPVFDLKPDNNSIYLGFINSLHHSIPKYNKWHICKSDDIYHELSISNNNCLIYIIEGGITDLADHLMTLMLYPLMIFVSKLKCRPNIVIVSGDHAAWCTRICLEKILKWHNIDGITISNTIQI